MFANVSSIPGFSKAFRNSPAGELKIPYIHRFGGEQNPERLREESVPEVPRPDILPVRTPDLPKADGGCLPYGHVSDGYGLFPNGTLHG